jgi:hypothetical protein
LQMPQPYGVPGGAHWPTIWHSLCAWQQMGDAQPSWGHSKGCAVTARHCLNSGVHEHWKQKSAAQSERARQASTPRPGQVDAPPPPPAPPPVAPPPPPELLPPPPPVLLPPPPPPVLLPPPPPVLLPPPPPVLPPPPPRADPPPEPASVRSSSESRPQAARERAASSRIRDRIGACHSKARSRWGSRGISDLRRRSLRFP